MAMSEHLQLAEAITEYAVNTSICLACMRVMTPLAKLWYQAVNPMSCKISMGML